MERSKTIDEESSLDEVSSEAHVKQPGLFLCIVQISCYHKLMLLVIYSFLCNNN